MAKMTEQEAWELDDLLTRTDPELGVNGTGFLSRRDARFMGLDNVSVNYLWTKARTEHKTPAQIIGEMVRERIAASVS
ncbi:MAG: hypothetical protein LBC60_05935 [Spirochaetaceae bacterium]|jgi:hypothetical protein|nr:hypothetical protein [Spirochaetaceae bacterium]